MVLFEARPIDRLDGDEAERDPDEQGVAARPALVEVDQRPRRAPRRRSRPRALAARARRRTRRAAGSPPAGTREPRHQDAPERRLGQAVVFSLCNRSSCCWHHFAPHSLKSIPQRRTRSTKSGSLPPGRAAIARRISRYSSWPRRRASSRPSACSRGRSSAKKSRSSDSSRSSTVVVVPSSHASAPRGRPRSARRRAARARRSRRPRPRSGPRPRAGAARGRSGRSSRPRRSASSGRRPS